MVPNEEENQMKKRKLVGLILIILTLGIGIGMIYLRTDAAVCYSGKGDKCEGECCVSNPFWCIAGPCNKIFR